MTLRLDQIVPKPLKDKSSLAQSAVWRKNIAFEQTEYVFIQAPSGTGKTTLIHILYGIRQDYEGTVYWEQQPLQQYSSESLASLRASQLSIVFQDMRLFPELTAWENLEIKRSLTNTVSAEEAANWMTRLGIGDKKDALAKTLSYGEQQRLSIVRALLQPYSFLLMDEPFSHLDKRNTALAAGLILEITKRNKAGMILADLDENSYFPYHKTLLL
jgi:ABC-type lipoprotein export system ATPase subunit